MVRLSMNILKSYAFLTKTLGSKSSTAVGEKLLYDFSVTGIDGQPLDMNQFRDKVVLIANVASKCGYTGNNYQQFSELLTKYHSQGLRILLFPCNQFGNQESGDTCAITGLAQHYHPDFILTEKVHVNGGDTHPVFAWLKEKASGFLVNTVKWNFTKFLVGRDGKVDPTRFAPSDEPNKMIPHIEKLLHATD